METDDVLVQESKCHAEGLLGDYADILRREWNEVVLALLRGSFGAQSHTRSMHQRSLVVRRRSENGRAVIKRVLVEKYRTQKKIVSKFRLVNRIKS